ncbi:MAG TPA: flagellar basal body-associated FliL family protein [Solirubrobacteraceae bacterium]|jgi:flagellar FliL protein
MLKGKRKFIPIGVVLLVLIVGYKMTSAKPVPKMKIKGTLYELPQTFLLNLQGNHYVKLDVALLLAPGQSDEAEGASSTSTDSEEALGTLPEEAAVRAIITNTITGQSNATLIKEAGRVKIKHEILEEISKQTDVKVESVLFPDLTVQ